VTFQARPGGSAVRHRGFRAGHPGDPAQRSLLVQCPQYVPFVTEQIDHTVNFEFICLAAGCQHFSFVECGYFLPILAV
jgi:hypothetical protein